jgi:hypothetical protein
MDNVKCFSIGEKNFFPTVSTTSNVDEILAIRNEKDCTQNESILNENDKTNITSMNNTSNDSFDHLHSYEYGRQDIFNYLKTTTTTSSAKTTTSDKSDIYEYPNLSKAMMAYKINPFTVKGKALLDTGAEVNVFDDLSWVPRNATYVERASKVTGITTGNLNATYEGHINGNLPFLIYPETPYVLLNPTLFSKAGININFHSSTTTWKIYDKYTSELYEIKCSDDNMFYVSKELTLNLQKQGKIVLPVQLSEVKTYTKEQRERAKQVRDLHYALSHPSNATLISALNNGVLIGTRLTGKDVKVYQEVFGPCPCCLAGKTTAPTYTRSMSAPAEQFGDKIHEDLLPYNDKNLGVILIT